MRYHIACLHMGESSEEKKVAFEGKGLRIIIGQYEYLDYGFEN